MRELLIIFLIITIILIAVLVMLLRKSEKYKCAKNNTSTNSVPIFWNWKNIKSHI